MKGIWISTLLVSESYKRGGDGPSASREKINQVVILLDQ